ncbi:hypothetical protein CJ030_MR1G023583 [Morella rubra]|uniref:Uncharacterized protein n=1 Tax=Morella rubra TaxID=262757 RepID=A0A6A1WTZ0_9ROSI|nr:hypothetical protein CJ030_MR1G023583 [Morella rubra]
MSSSRPTRSSQRTPASVGSKGKKKARTTEEPTPTPEDYIYRSGLCKNRFVQDFRNRKVIAGRWADFQMFFFEFNGNAPDAGKKFFENHGWVATSASKRGRGRTRGVSLEKSLGGLGPGNYRCISRRESVEECLPLLPPIDEDWNVGPRADSDLVNKWDHFDLDYTRQEDKRSEQNKKNRSKLTVNHAAGSRSFQRTRACMERMDAFQRQCDLEGKTYTEIEVYSEILGKKSGYVRGLGRRLSLRLHQL